MFHERRTDSGTTELRSLKQNHKAIESSSQQIEECKILFPLQTSTISSGESDSTGQESPRKKRKQKSPKTSDFPSTPLAQQDSPLHSVSSNIQLQSSCFSSEVSTSPLCARLSETTLNSPDSDNKHKRKRKTPDQLAILETSFRINPMPDKQVRDLLGYQLGLTSRQVQIWFQNKRAKVKNEQRTDQISDRPILASQLNSQTSSIFTDPALANTSSPILGEDIRGIFYNPNSSSLRFDESRSYFISTTHAYSPEERDVYSIPIPSHVQNSYSHNPDSYAFGMTGIGAGENLADEVLANAHHINFRPLSPLYTVDPINPMDMQKNIFVDSFFDESGLSNLNPDVDNCNDSFFT